MSLQTMLFALNAPVKTPEQRVVLIFLAEFANTDEQVVCEVSELCARIPIGIGPLTNALHDLCDANVISMKLPIRTNIIRVNFNIEGGENGF